MRFKKQIVNFKSLIINNILKVITET
jgi:hypothetical protein